MSRIYLKNTDNEFLKQKKNIRMKLAHAIVISHKRIKYYYTHPSNVNQKKKSIVQQTNLWFNAYWCEMCVSVCVCFECAQNWKPQFALKREILRLFSTAIIILFSRIYDISTIFYMWMMLIRVGSCWICEKWNRTKQQHTRIQFK